ncbi:MAG: 6-phosphofructokinase [Oscillospiraceae bacterium]|nr:6-phosphofructokinase [Oscillospiraceae bacterium]
MVNTIAVLTSGGDAPGMNAAIRAVVREGKFHNLKMVGVRKGYKGLLHGDFAELTARNVSDTLGRGGTILQTARCKEFREPEGYLAAIEKCRYAGIDGLIVIGGDGSFRGVRDLAGEGFPVIGIPGTIDNDIPYTDYTIGFDTAVNTAVEAVDKIRVTASSHHRCNIIEVMGRNSGQIAINVGIACGAEAAIIPEMVPEERPDIVQVINDGIRRGKTHFIIVLAEGIGGAEEMRARAERETGITTRTNILGYMQRGGVPTVRDRVMASLFGVHAVRLLLEGKFGRLVGTRNGEIYDIDVEEGLAVEKPMDREIIETAMRLSI